MTNLFGQLTSDANVEKPVDVVGGGFELLKSGIYQAKIVQAYVRPSKNSSSIGVTVQLEVISKDRATPYKHTETIYVSNSQGSKTYTKNGKSYFMVGYLTISDLVKAACGKTLETVTVSERLVELYDPNAKKAVPQPVPCLVDIINQNVAVALVHQVVNKQALTNGSYQDTNEKRDQLVIQKIFKVVDGVPYTMTELEVGAEPVFAEKWLERWKDKVDNRFREIAEASGKSHAATTELSIG